MDRAANTGAWHSSGNGVDGTAKTAAKTNSSPKWNLLANGCLSGVVPYADYRLAFEMREPLLGFFRPLRGLNELHSAASPRLAPWGYPSRARFAGLGLVLA